MTQDDCSSLRYHPARGLLRIPDFELNDADIFKTRRSVTRSWISSRLISKWWVQPDTCAVLRETSPATNSELRSYLASFPSEGKRLSLPLTPNLAQISSPSFGNIVIFSLHRQGCSHLGSFQTRILSPFPPRLCISLDRKVFHKERWLGGSLHKSSVTRIIFAIREVCVIPIPSFSSLSKRRAS